MTRVHALLAPLCAALVAGACTAPALIAVGPEGALPRSISVTGRALTQVPPDIVKWQITTSSTNPNLIRAKEESDAQVQSVLKAARDHGIAERDLQTGQLSIDKEYERNDFRSPGVFKHFKVVRVLTLTQRDVGDFDKLLTGLVQGADIDVRYRLTSSKLPTIRAETRREAVKAARDKATAMAEVLGERLGQVLELNESVGPSPGYRAMNNIHLERRDVGEGEADATFAPGIMDVRVTVNAVFALR